MLQARKRDDCFDCDESRSQSGMSQLGVAFCGIVICAAIWVAYTVGPFFYNAEELRGLMESQVKKAQVLSDDDMKLAILKKINELNLPIEDPDDLKINRFNGNIVIELKYDEVLFLDLFGKTYDLWVFHFHPRAEHPL